jgi:hypothetical protein
MEKVSTRWIKQVAQENNNAQKDMNDQERFKIIMVGTMTNSLLGCGTVQSGKYLPWWWRQPVILQLPEISITQHRITVQELVSVKND